MKISADRDSRHEVHEHVFTFFIFKIKLVYISVSESESEHVGPAGYGVAHTCLCFCDTVDSSPDPLVRALSAACIVELTARRPF